jgi:hypothetical protein
MLSIANYVPHTGMKKNYILAGCRTDSSDSGQRPMAGPPDHGNEPSSSIKAGNFLTS